MFKCDISDVNNIIVYLILNIEHPRIELLTLHTRKRDIIKQNWH